MNVDQKLALYEMNGGQKLVLYEVWLSGGLLI